MELGNKESNEQFEIVSLNMKIDKISTKVDTLLKIVSTQRLQIWDLGEEITKVKSQMA